MLASKYADPDALPLSPPRRRQSRGDSLSAVAKEEETAQSPTAEENMAIPETPPFKQLPREPEGLDDLADVGDQTASNMSVDKASQSETAEAIPTGQVEPEPLPQPALLPATPPSPPEQTVNVLPETQTGPISPSTTLLEPKVGSKGSDIPKTPSPDMITKNHVTKPPVSALRIRSKKGKTCAILLPSNENKDYSGFALPMSAEEIQERISAFEKEGFETRGYNFLSPVPESVATDEEVQGRAEFPDPEEQREEQRERFVNRQFGISIPIKKEWDDYVQHLNEEKLRKLGVSFGDEPALPPAPGPMLTRAPLSRTATSPYPPLPFSPPIPLSSAGSQQGWQNYMPFSAPFSPAASTNNTSSGQAMSPIPQFGQSFVGQQGRQSSLGYSFPPGQVPPIHRTWSQQQVLQSALQRGESPASLLNLSKQLSESARQSPANNELKNDPPQGQNAETPDESNLDWGKIGRRRSQAVGADVVEKLNDQSQADEPKPTSNPTAGSSDYLASPKPQGHRHNLSAHLEREAENAEYYPGEYVNASEPLRPTVPSQQPFGFPIHNRNPSQFGQTLAHLSKPSQTSNSSSQLNVAAKEFIFNPGKSQSIKPLAPVSRDAFMPSKAAKAADATSTVSFATAHSHQGSVSLSNLNVSAPEFKPPAQKNFAFSTNWFNFSKKPDPLAKSDTPAQEAKALEPDVNKKESSIFGNLAEIIKPSTKSKAVAIVDPKEIGVAGIKDDSELEDESGRITQSSSRNKKSRFSDKNGDEVPRFAEPTPEPESASASPPPRVQLQVTSETSLLPKQPSPLREAAEDNKEDLLYKPRPLQIEYDLDVSGNMSDESNVPWHGIEGDEDTAQSNGRMKLHEHRSLAASPAASSGVEEADEENLRRRSQAPSPQKPDAQEPAPSPVDNQASDESHLYPTFKDADDITEYINNDNSDFGIEEGGQFQRHAPTAKRSPTSLSVSAEPPTAKRDLISLSPDESEGGFGKRSMDTFARSLSRNRSQMRTSASPVRRLNKMAEAPVSDWDDMLSSGEELKIPQHHYLSDAHMVGLVEGLLKRHLAPVERTMRELGASMIHNARRDYSRDTRRPISSYEKSNSDADDEDDPTQELQQPKRDHRSDKRLEQVKTAVVEAMHAAQAGGLGQIEQEVKFRKAAEHRANDLQRIIDLSEKEIELLKESTSSLDEKISGLEDERDDALRRHMIVEEELRSKTLSFTAEVAALENTLDEYRSDHKKWREEIDSVKDSRETLQDTISALKREAAENSDEVDDLTTRNASLKEQLSTFSTQIGAERSDWKRQEDKQAAEIKDLQEKLADSQETRQALKAESKRLSELEKEAIKGNLMLQESNEARQSLKAEVGRLIQIEKETVKTKLMLEESNATRQALKAEAERLSEKEKEAIKTSIMLEESNETRKALKTEVERLTEKENEAIRAKVMLEETQKAKANLETVANKLNEKAIEHRTIVAHYEREASEAHENTALEVQRTKSLLEMDIQIANKRVENIRADLETRLQMAKSELENVRKDHDSVRARYERSLNESIAARKEAVQEINSNHSTRLQEERRRFDTALKELSEQHDRAMRNAHEDKQRSDTHLSSQLKLSEAKKSHLEERAAHLEERLSVAQDAAQAAISAAQAAKASSVTPISTTGGVTRSIATPAHLEKISPQALRESIVVLQEQLQDREARIERLESGSRPGSADQDSADRLREREAEVTWLREILGVRIDDLTDLVNNLQMERFDRGAARNAAIRLKANLQMEQQERERKTAGTRTAGSPALPTLTDIQNFASPKAAQLSSAFANWRKNPPSLAEMRQRQAEKGTPSRSGAGFSSPARAGSSKARNVQQAQAPTSSGASIGNPTSSRPTMMNPMAAAAMANANSSANKQPQTEAQTFLSGLMTPPASNLRRTPSTKASGPNTARPRTPNRSISRPGTSDSLSGSPEKNYGGSTSPLLRKGDYDLDAELGSEELDYDEDSDPPAQSSKANPKKEDKTEETMEKTKLEPVGGVIA